MRTDITTQIVRNGWPILGLSAYTEDIERSVIAKGNEQLTNYGVAITRMGNFDINLSPEDSTSLKRLARDTSYSRLAGSFNQYAAGEMQIGAGEGMAQGGGAVSGAFLGAGLGIGGGMARAGAVPAHGSPGVRFRRRRPERLPGPAGPGGPGRATAARAARFRRERRAARAAADRRVPVVSDRQFRRGEVLPELRPADGPAQGPLHQLRS